MGVGVRLRRPWMGMMLLVVVALVGSACGSIAEKATEQIIEKAVENSEGGDVELDLDVGDGSLSLETEDGSIQMGTGLDLPDNLEVPVPTGGDVTSTQTGDGYVQASISFPQDRFDELVEFYEDWVASQSGEFQTSNSQYSNDGEVFRNHNWYDNESGITVGVSDCFSISDEGMAACVSVFTDN